MINYQLIEFERSFGNASQLEPSDRPEIVFSGRSNVGKSSLINKLCGRKALARTSQVPGKTVTINFYRHPDFRLVDLPGYGYARRSKAALFDWGALMESYFGSGRRIALAVALMDIRHEPNADDRMMVDYLYRCGFSFVIAASKCDKATPEKREAFAACFPSEFAEGIIPVSSVSGEGLDRLRSEIAQAVSQ